MDVKALIEKGSVWLMTFGLRILLILILMFVFIKIAQFANSAIIIKARTKTKPIRQWAVGREFNKRLKKKFDETNIEIPFSHVTLYMGQDKQGLSPALNVNMKQN